MSLEALADKGGAQDLFVFHRLEEGRLVNLDGHGRGAGWAGTVVVEEAEEPVLAEAMRDGLVRVDGPSPTRIFGPYWAAEAVAVALGEHVVVFGGPHIDRDEELLRTLAADAIELVSEVPVAKRLADELEVSQAALAVATMRPATLHEAATRVAALAAGSLSCEFGAVLLPGPPLRLSIADEGWRPVADDEEVAASLLPLVQAARQEMVVEQDLSRSAFGYHPLSFADGLVSRLSVALGQDGSLGLLVVAHAAGTPRGFTSLCRRVAAAIARTGAPVIEEALRREAVAT